MKEMQSLLKMVSDGLKTLAQGVEAIAEKVDEASKIKSPAKPKPKRPATAAKKAKSVKTPAPGTAKKKAAKPTTAVDTVLNIIGRSKNGVNTASIKAKTGYDQKKVANIIYKLKKQGKIKSIEKGVYMKS
jgi:DNA replicative helicase MCM subunit Mcm2 (Cdc46/Mcm family)